MSCFYRSSDKVQILFEAKRRIPVFARPSVIGFTKDIVPIATNRSVPVEMHHTFLYGPNLDRPAIWQITDG
jgi:hypothetical protein